MSLEAWGDSDEGWAPNPFDDMVATLRAQGQLRECPACRYHLVLIDKPCPQCGWTDEDS